MRGKLIQAVMNVCDDRITPADAGKTVYAGSGAVVAWDHPRGCGENKYGNFIGHIVPGSPPRMRGKLYDCTLFPKDLRITPADAGKTGRA